MPTSIDPLIRFLDYIGVVDVVIPFVLLFTLLYAFFEKTKVLGVEKGHPYHRLNMLAAMVLSLLVIGSAKLTGLTNSLVQYLGLFAVIILAFVMILGLFGIEHLPQHRVWNLVIFVFFISMAVYVFSTLGLFGRNNQLVIAIFVLFFAAVFVFKIWFTKPAAPQVSSSPAPASHKPGSGSVTPKAASSKEKVSGALKQFAELSPEEKQGFIGTLNDWLSRSGRPEEENP